MAVESSGVQSYEKQVGNSYFFSPFPLISRRLYKKESRKNFDCTNVASPGMVGSVAETADRTSSYASTSEKSLDTSQPRQENDNGGLLHVRR